MSDWLIVYCLKSSKQYFSYIQDESKFHIKLFRNGEIMGKPDEQLLTAPKHLFFFDIYFFFTLEVLEIPLNYVLNKMTYIAQL
jgi:hypothetical protein